MRVPRHFREGLEGEILQHLSHEAARLLAWRSWLGVFFFPTGCLILAMIGSFAERAPLVLYTVLAGVFAAAGIRLLLIFRFDTLYPGRERLWLVIYTTCLAVMVLGWAFMCCWTYLTFGFGEAAFFALIASATMAGMAIIIYAASPLLVNIYLACLFLPQLFIFLWADFELSTWLSLGAVIFGAYLFTEGRALHREFWRGLTTARRLAEGKKELEQTRESLQRAHADLEARIAERTTELQQRESEYQQIFQHAHDAILILAPENEEVLEINPKACELYGFTREEFLGRSLHSLSEPFSRARRHVDETLSTSKYYRFETVQRRKDGRKVHLEVHASPIVYRGRQAILSLNRDITERRRAEELRLAKEAAERASQAKSEFLANMSHEIRTPMGGIIGLADLLHRSELSVRDREYVDLIQASAGALLRVIDDILDLSKIEAGKLSLEKEPFDLAKLVVQLRELLAPRAVEKGLELQVQMEEEEAWLYGDATRLRQVLMNLLGNAVKFTDGGSIVLQVARRPVAEATNLWRFTIRDTGIGIAPEVQPLLFTPFTQADGSTSRRFGGTGLGLAISKHLVEMMAGKIELESEAGVGSTFTFTVVLPEARGSQQESGDLLSAAVRRLRGQHRILLAEDNPVNRLVAMKQLEASGYRAVAVENGAEALHELGREPYDLVLMDCQMPEIDGYEATRRIRRGEAGGHQPVIVALTASAMKGDRQRCREAGMDDYLSKPFRDADLQSVLDHWLLERDDLTPQPSDDDEATKASAGGLR